MKKIISVSFFIMLWGLSSGQGYFSEIEVTVGYSIIQGDFGEKGNFSSNLGNTGFLLGGKAYIDCYSCSRIKFPLILNIGYSGLGFDNAYKDTELTPDLIKTKALSGYVYQGLIGAGVEFHIGDLSTYSQMNSDFLRIFDPYIGGFIGLTGYSVHLESELGDFKAYPDILPSAFKNSIYDKPGIVFTSGFEGGFRYWLKSNLTITVNSRWIYYASDKVDGLMPDPDRVSNTHNDWLFAPSIGVVFFLDNSGFY